MSCHPLTGRAPFQQNVGPVANELGILERGPRRRLPCVRKGADSVLAQEAQPDVARRR